MVTNRVNEVINNRSGGDPVNYLIRLIIKELANSFVEKYKDDVFNIFQKIICDEMGDKTPHGFYEDMAYHLNMATIRHFNDNLHEFEPLIKNHLDNYISTVTDKTFQNKLSLTIRNAIQNLIDQTISSNNEYK